jgi:hypothetical protein
MKQVREMVRVWTPRLLLNEWTIEVLFASENCEDGAFAECQSSTMYLDANIIIYPKFWTEPYDKWEDIVVHELVHCLTARVSNMLDSALQGRLYNVRDIEFNIEQLTQRITNVAIRGKR